MKKTEYKTNFAIDEIQKRKEKWKNLIGLKLKMVSNREAENLNKPKHVTGQRDGTIGKY